MQIPPGFFGITVLQIDTSSWDLPLRTHPLSCGKPQPQERLHCRYSGRQLQLNPPMRSSNQGQRHVNEEVSNWFQPPSFWVTLRLSSLRCCGSEINHPAVPCSNSWPTGSVNITKWWWFYATEFCGYLLGRSSKLGKLILFKTKC